MRAPRVYGLLAKPRGRTYRKGHEIFERLIENVVAREIENKSEKEINKTMTPRARPFLTSAFHRSVAHTYS